MSLTTPTVILQPFANAGTKNAIPNTGAGPGLAAYDTGYPDTNFMAKADGGIPPSGGDANGIQFDITTHVCWLEAGNGYVFSSAFATAIGGYPVGAILRSASVAGRYFYCNTAANTNDPDVTPTGWAPFSLSGTATGVMSDAPTAGTHNDVAITAGVGFYECTPGGAVTITGFVAGVDGQILTVTNLHASNVLTLAARTGSTSANQLRLPTGGLILLQYQSATFKYSSTVGMWLPI